MKYNLFFIILFLSITLNAQIIGNKKDYNRESRLQLSFIYPIGTNGIYSYEKTNNFSLNLLAGVNGGVNGIELGGFININRYDVRGIQLSGFGNVNGGNTGGIQLSGFANINMGNTRGLQGSGFININHFSDQIIQLTGFANITEDFGGMQAAGFINVAKDAGIEDSSSGYINDTYIKSGVQLAGFANVAEDVNGIQFAGFINIAKKVKGVQIAGFINICDSLDGLSLAVVNYVKLNGYRKISIWSNETFYLNTSYKMGIEKFYTIFNLGYRPNTGLLNWSAGIGLGTVFTLMNNNYIDLEGIHHAIIDYVFWREYDEYYDYHSLNQIKISFRHQLSNNLSLFGGPTFNLLITQNEDEVRDIAPSWALKNNARYSTLYSWFGFNAGIQF